MTGLSEKVFLRLGAPTEDVPVSDHRRLQAALLEKGYDNIQIPLQILQRLYPLCRQEAGITVTMVFREDDTEVTQIEPGDTTAQHYGLAVDYGSTTVHPWVAPRKISPGVTCPARSRPILIWNPLSPSECSRICHGSGIPVPPTHPWTAPELCC